jgi:nitroreductase
VAALDNEKAPLSIQNPLPAFPVLSEEKARHFLRSRRSIRCYQQRPVPRAKILDLMDIARFAPSGGNSQGISYRVIDRQELLSQLTEQTIAWMEEPAQKNSAAAKVYAQYVSIYRQTGSDSILRNAPVLVLGTSANTFARGRENTLLSLAYVELLAPALGLGTCWAGLLEAAAFSGFAPLLDLLAIPKDLQLTGALMVGFPKYFFRRLVTRNQLDLIFQED